VSVCALELNDAGLLLGDGTRVLAESPAFATLTAQGLTVGAAARARARLDPRQTLSQFWQRLGTEPLPHPTRVARHHADLAYAHLLQVHEAAGRPMELVLAVPASFTREQLAILLGVAARCPFRAVGLVDSALAAVAGVPSINGALHLELQLHQCVLTHLVREGDSLVRGAVRTLPGTGLVQMTERWARRAAASFIQQTRFDPLHAAATEQQLYDRLPQWLAALATGDDVTAELQHGSARHSVRLRTDDMLDAVQALYTQIREALAAENGKAGVLLGARAAGLLRFAAQFAGAIALPPDAALRGALLHLALIRSEAPALRFVTRLPAPAPVAVPPSAPALQLPPAPTHLLLGDRALRLPPGESYLHRMDGSNWRIATCPPAGDPACCTFAHDGETCWLLARTGDRLRLDEVPVHGRVRIDSGARLRLADGRELLFVTEVAADGNGA
jgi:hypothetical protein